MPRARHIVPALLLAVACALLGAPAGAQAGIYVVAPCVPPAGLGEWRFEAPSYFETYSACDAEGLTLRIFNNEDSPSVPEGTHGAVRFSVPSPYTIYGLAAVVSGSYGDAPTWSVELRDASELLLLWNSQEPVHYSRMGLLTPSVELVFTCHPENQGANCLENGSPTAALDDPQLYIEVPTPPSVPSVSGALLSEQYAAGAVGESWSASDPLTGIHRALVLADGKIVGEETLGCAVNGEFSHAPQLSGAFQTINPCPDNASGEVTLQTTTLPDGHYNLTLAVEDAAGNRTSAAAEHELIIDNNGPPAPEALHATATDPADYTYALSWSQPTPPAAPVTRTLFRYCAGTTGSCSSPVEVSGTSTSVSLPSSGPWLLELEAIDATGKASPWASTAIEVPAPPSTTTSTTSATGTSSGTQSTTTTSTSTTTTTSTSTTSSAPSALGVSATMADGVLTISAQVPASSGTVKLSAHIRRDGREVQSCVRTVAVHNHRASASFVVAPKARGGRATVRVLYDGHSAAAQARYLKHSRRRRARLRLRRRRLRLARCTIRPERR